MKRLFLSLLICLFSLLGFAQKIELEGTYQGKNIYVQNPASGTDSYCSEKILVNGKEIPFKHSSAYEIRLDTLELKIGDPVKIEIFHKADCKPKVITQNYTPKGNFDLVSIKIDSSFVLHWVSKNEINKLTYTIEQFRWNKWVKIGEVDGKGGVQTNAYSFQTQPHSGKNKFRVKQIASGKPRISEATEFEVPDFNIKIIDHSINNDQLEFTRETMYELYDVEGNLIKKGTAKSVDMKGLKRGHYFVNYDNETSEIDKIY